VASATCSLKILCDTSLWRTGSDGLARVRITPYTPKSRHIYGATPLQLARCHALIGAIPVIAQLEGGRIMANRRVDDIAEDLTAVVDFVRQSANGARSGEIAEALKDIPQRTLQRWLKSLVESGRLAQVGKGPAARYRLPAIVEEQKETAARQAGQEEEKPEEVVTPLSVESAQIRAYLRQLSMAE